jgi:hypothetical protein
MLSDNRGEGAQPRWLIASLPSGDSCAVVTDEPVGKKTGS